MSNWKSLTRTIINCNNLGNGGNDPGCLKCQLTESEGKFKIHPNPAKSIVNVELHNPENILDENSKITGELLDLMGQSKTKFQIENYKATFSVQDFNKGIYVLKIYINDEVETHQVIIE